MNADFSAGVDRALRRALGYAQAEGRNEVTPGDLLHGLLADDEGLPFLHVVAAAVDKDRLRRLLPTAPLESEADAAVEAERDLPPLSNQSREVLRQAGPLSRAHAPEGTIATEHLLLALLENDAASLRRLEEIGLNLDELRQRIAPEHPPIAMEGTLDLALDSDSAQVARILDASANRAREALRVLEDYCRFALDDAYLARKLKTLRHDLTAALSDLPADWLLGHRDTLHDVGTRLSTPSEGERSSAVAVLAANAKRLQEALRSLEEYGKVVSPDLGHAFESQRYQAYTIERALLRRQDAHPLLRDARLYALVSERLCKLSLAGTVRELVEGGVQILQMREKNLNDRELLDRARELRKMTAQASVLFIVNDRPDIALLSGADGVHLGQDDLPLHEARRILGPRVLIGVSTHDLDQVRQAVLEGADYIGVGPTFPSQTKDFDALAGLHFVRSACAETSLPAFVLGGVTLKNLDQVLAAGGRRIAVSHAVCASDNPRETAQALRSKL